MKTLELEIVQGFFFYPHYAFRYIFVAQFENLGELVKNTIFVA